MRHAARVDANHAAIVQKLRQAGFEVISLATVGDGVPDILVGMPLVNVLFEIKDGTKTPSNRRLKPAQVSFLETWPGPVHVVLSPDEALRVALAYRNSATFEQCHSMLAKIRCSCHLGSVCNRACRAGLHHSGCPNE